MPQNTNPVYNNTLAGGANGVNGSFSPSYSNGHGYSVNSITVTGGVGSLSLQRRHPHIMFTPKQNGDVGVYFMGTGDPAVEKPVIQGEFKPERDITAWEYQLIAQMELLVMIGSGQGVLDKLDMIQYIRKHNLERHFVFSTLPV